MKIKILNESNSDSKSSGNLSAIEKKLLNACNHTIDDSLLMWVGDIKNNCLNEKYYWDEFLNALSKISYAIEDGKNVVPLDNGFRIMFFPQHEDGSKDLLKTILNDFFGLRLFKLDLDNLNPDWCNKKISKDIDNVNMTFILTDKFFDSKSISYLLDITVKEK